MAEAFTPTTLPQSIRQLFELNNYDVGGPVQIHGAEIDLVATPKSDPFGTPIYIEATIEYVSNDKYGKDVGKLAMIGELEKGARRLIVSSAGFSLPVKERAGATRIETLTYDELFARFEQFGPYVTHVCTGDLGAELESLNSRYVEPQFEDALGREAATPFLGKWRDDESAKKRWLIVVGEYGTGKTALSKILQYRWLQEYQRRPASPIPFRIELRDFTRQFDARGLIHHFLDYNRLGHVPIDFVLSLIRRGRVILLLDGYDEMAQYMHARERRACLEALADLAADGAKGILTSRPNYFSETEELQLFEVLYSSLAANALIESAAAKDVIERERSLDQLITSQFLERYERSLRDLTPEQTEKLVQRSLDRDPEGAAVVLGILRRIFRTAEEGAAVALSGKPVIITYLLEIVESLKSAPEQQQQQQQLSEWQVYKMIVNQLMLRDLRRSDYILPDKRRQVLRSLSAFLSRRDAPSIGENDFRELIRREFAEKLRGRPADDRENEVERLYADLRGSSTLTRSTDPSKPGWRFSHNSLREFLLSEEIIARLNEGDGARELVPVSDTMRMFVASQAPAERRELLRVLAAKWPERRLSRWVSLGFNLIWDAAVSLFTEFPDPVNAALKEITGAGIALDGMSLERLRMSSPSKPPVLRRSNWSDSELRDVDLSGADLEGANFVNAVLENVNLSVADLSAADLSGSLMYGVNMTSARVAGANFSNIDEGSISILIGAGASGEEPQRLDGVAALGYLSFAGATTDEVPPYWVYKHHEKFPIVEKICRKFAEQPQRQRRGLEQRGAARADTSFARDFMKFLESSGFMETTSRSDMVTATPAGVDMCKRLVERRELAPELLRFLKQ